MNEVDKAVQLALLATLCNGAENNIATYKFAIEELETQIRVIQAIMRELEQ